jgi:hypothetical protein
VRLALACIIRRGVTCGVPNVAPPDDLSVEGSRQKAWLPSPRVAERTDRRRAAGGPNRMPPVVLRVEVCEV